jgi:hypothetical protein
LSLAGPAPPASVRRRRPIGLDANDMATGGRRIFCSLQRAGSVDRGCLVGVIHLLVTGWWSLIPLEGSLHVDEGWPAEQPASDLGEHEVWPGHSTFNGYTTCFWRATDGHET